VTVYRGKLILQSKVRNQTKPSFIGKQQLLVDSKDTTLSTFLKKKQKELYETIVINTKTKERM